ADARRITREIAAFALDVIRGALTREAHGNVRVAFARGEAVAHRGDQNVGDLNLFLGDDEAADLKGNFRTVRIRNLERRGDAARLRDRIAAWVAAAERRTQPRATDVLGILDIPDLDDDAMA